MKSLVVFECSTCPYHVYWSDVPSNPMDVCYGKSYARGEYCKLSKSIQVTKKGIPKDCPLPDKDGEK